MSHHIVILSLVALAVLLLNIPFGYWRQGTRRFSWPWLAAIHLPIPFVITLRLVSGLGWKWHTFPIIISAYFLGQSLGARWRRFRRPPTGQSCPSEHHAKNPSL